ncbi:MAG TPA: carboxypeptidase-like regulatory domain-containing protein [Longimicrobium sp.]|nr:carboxypeptidase-like regulatory domain-containing protein [Longimicrobium sp.]
MRLSRKATRILLCAALAALPRLLAAQEVQGRVTAAFAAAPGSLVELLDQAGRPVSNAAADGAGAFRIRAPGPGSYRLRAGQIGFQSALSAPFALREGERLALSLSITPRTVTLEGVVATARPRCEAVRTSGAALERVWEEARKALALTVRTAADSSIGYDFATYVRTTEARSDTLVEDSTSLVRMVGGVPFASVPVGELDQLGFVRNVGGRVVFFGPDAEVLLSDDFLAQHCFSLRQGRGAEAGLIGLAFEPVPSRRRPDVRGVLWLDPRSSELRHLEWQYTRVRAQARYAPRGRADFVRLPGGAWIIRAWWLRLPAAWARMDAGRDGFTLHYDYVEGVREVGGTVARVWSARGP